MIPSVLYDPDGDPRPVSLSIAAALDRAGRWVRGLVAAADDDADPDDRPGTAYTSRRHGGGGKRTLHEDEECHYLRMADDYRDVDVAAFPEDFVKWCASCSDGPPRSETRGRARA